MSNSARPLAGQLSSKLLNLCGSEGFNECATYSQMVAGLHEHQKGAFIEGSSRGSRFPKDILDLSNFCESKGLNKCTKYWQMVAGLNEHQKEAFIERIISRIGSSCFQKDILKCASVFADGRRYERAPEGGFHAKGERYVL